MEWMKEAITKQLSLLMLLQLDFSPRAEDVARMRDLWVYAFTRAIGTPNEAQDRKRINDAFLGAMHELKKWPPPAEIIGRMASRRPVDRILYEPTDVAPEKIRDFMSLLGQRMAGDITQEELEEKVERIK